MNFDGEENNKQIKTVLAELPPVREAPIACHGTVKSGSSGLLVKGSRPDQVCRISSKTVCPVRRRAFSDVPETTMPSAVANGMSNTAFPIPAVNFGPVL